MAVNDFTRFESKFERIPFCGCWLWTASLVGKKSPYGRFYIDPRNELAHRASWMLHKGAIPEGMDVLHRCDVPACVNPDHLFLGTAADNIADRIAKGRPHNVPTGEKNGQSKLNYKSAEEMRHLYARGATQDDLVRKFKVSKGAVYYVLKRITWAHESS